MWDCVKTAFLFIGAMIGAGFATGSELMVYFREFNAFTVALSAVILGFLVFFFCCMGKRMERYKATKIIIKITMTISCISSLMAMTAGGNEIMQYTFAIPLIGAFSTAISAITSIFPMRFTKNLNAIIIPILLIMIAIIAIKADYVPLPTEFSVGRAITYAAMNCMLGGYLLAYECKSMSMRARAFVSAIVSVTIGVLMIIVYMLAQSNPYSSMPLYELSRMLELSKIAGIVIYLAILSTILGASKVVHDNITAFTRSKVCATVVIIIIAIAASFCDFGEYVNRFYPLSGQLGICVLAILGMTLIVSRLNDSGIYLLNNRFCHRMADLRNRKKSS